VTRADLRVRPESHLFFPGSTIVAHVGADQTPTRAGEEPNPAYIGAVLIVGATSSQLYAWYGSRLQPRGFRPVTDYRLASQTSGRAWQIHHREQVQVGVFDPGLLKIDGRSSVVVAAGSIVYELDLVGYPPGLPRG
jgi:hypothetical protein